VTIRKRIVALIAFFALAVLAPKAPAQAPPNTIWMTSTLKPAGDGVNISVDCQTTAQNPSNSSNISAVATAVDSPVGSTDKSYSGLSTVCNVYPVGQPGSPIWSSNSSYTYTNSSGNQVSVQAACATGGGNAVLGSGVSASFAAGQYTSDCKGTFAYTPGVAYQLTSQHYLWIANTCGSTAPYYDTLSWYDYIDPFDVVEAGEQDILWNSAPDSNGWWSTISLKWGKFHDQQRHQHPSRKLDQRRPYRDRTSQRRLLFGWRRHMLASLGYNPQYGRLGTSHNKRHLHAHHNRHSRFHPIVSKRRLLPVSVHFFPVQSSEPPSHSWPKRGHPELVHPGPIDAMRNWEEW
jgi:hypothetical protein